MRPRFGRLWFVVFFILILSLSACGTSPPESGRLNVVATTTIIGDVVSNVGGEHISLTVLVPVGADPHSFQPVPQDLAAIAEADVVFINGLGLEKFLVDLLENAGGEAQVALVSEGVPLIGDNDPHVWLDVENVIVWMENITATLTALDPQNAAAYQANAESYQTELESLHRELIDQFAEIPPARRVMVTDHDAFLYFAQAYGFTLVGAVIPSYSTLAEPSAQELVELEDAIRALGAPAVFVGTTVSPGLVRRVAEDTGMQLVTLYTGSLSAAGGPAATYVEMMRFNAAAVAGVLGE